MYYQAATWVPRLHIQIYCRDCCILAGRENVTISSELRPALPRYKSIWDLNILFSYFRGRPAAPKISLKEFILKPTFLLNLLSGQRCQTIKYFNTDNMELTSDKWIFHITDKVKQTRMGTHIPPLSFVAYPKGKKLCIISRLQEYLKQTTPFRKDSKQLLLSHVKPHGPVRKDNLQMVQVGVILCRDWYIQLQRPHYKSHIVHPPCR